MQYTAIYQLKYCNQISTIVGSQPYKYLNYNLLEAALKAKFGRITAYFEYIKRDASWYYQAKKKGTLKVVDLEIACDHAGIHPADVLKDRADDDGSIVEDAAIASRLQQLVNATTGTTLDFALKTGIQHVELKYLIDKSGRLTMSMLKRILVNFPNTNTLWLLHGQGKMFMIEESKEHLEQMVADKQRIIDLLESKNK